jgi:hypothetical protein
VTVVILAITLVLVPMLLTEFTDWLPWIATRLIRRAAAQLPAERRARYAEEWAAEFSALPGGKLAKLAFGLRLCAHARATGAVLREEVKAEQERAQFSLDTAQIDHAVARVLALAQQTADKTIADACREADETICRARREADETLARARRAAREIVRSAKNAIPPDEGNDMFPVS